MILKATSHRAAHKIKAAYPDAEPMFILKSVLARRRSFAAYYRIKATDPAKIKGVTKAVDQDEEHYSHCW